MYVNIQRNLIDESFLPHPITSENIHHLYRAYDVTIVKSTDLSLIKSKKIYESSLYFSRLMKMENHVQVAVITFFGWNIPYIDSTKGWLRF